MKNPVVRLSDGGACFSAQDVEALAELKAELDAQ